MSVLQRDYSCRISLSQLRIVRDHYHKPVGGYLLQYLHDLNACPGVKRTRRLVGKEYFRVIYDRAGNSHPLHLTAGQLIRLFKHLIAESDAGKRLLRTFSSFLPFDPGERQGKLDICQHRLMRYQVIALKHKSDRVVSVRIPFPVGVFFRRSAAYYQVAGGVFVKSSDNIEQCGLSAAGLTEHRHELAFSEFDINTAESLDALPSGSVNLLYSPQFKHFSVSSQNYFLFTD